MGHLRVIVTRPRDQAGTLAERIEQLGHEPVLCPLIRIEPLGDGPIDVSGYDWVIVTSANGARELARRRRGEPRRLAAVGPNTAAALAEHGMRPDLVPRESSQEGLLAALPQPAGRVLFAGAEGARRLLADELSADFVPLYRTIPTPPSDPPDGDLVVLASPSAARVWSELGIEIAAVSIGPETTRAAEATGINVLAQGRSYDLDGLVQAIEEAAVTLRPCSSRS
jgi:uroporphyrinogen-III synthase